MTTPLDELAEYVKAKPGTPLFRALWKYDASYSKPIPYIRRSREQALVRLANLVLGEDWGDKMVAKLLANMEGEA